MTEIADNGTEVELTEEEAKVVRAIQRLDKMKFGRVLLFGASGSLHVRIFDAELGLKGDADATIMITNIPCDGGDGGDRFYN